MIKIQMIAICGWLFFSTLAFAQTQELQINSYKIQKLKTEIISIAKKGTKYKQDLKLVRKQLNTKIAALIAASPSKSIQQKLMESVGSWKNLWSDLEFGVTDSSQVYQVVFPDGYFYDISKDVQNGQTYTGFLRGKYSVRKTDFQIEFTKSVLASSYFSKGTDLAKIAMQAELGRFDGLPNPQGQDGLGMPGELGTLYVDDSLRILTGSLGENGVINVLFILIPQSQIH